jgi:hypothetical protein
MSLSLQVSHRDWLSFCQDVQTATMDLSEAEKALRITEITPEQNQRLCRFIGKNFSFKTILTSPDKKKIKITVENEDQLPTIRKLMTYISLAKTKSFERSRYEPSEEYMSTALISSNKEKDTKTK